VSLKKIKLELISKVKMIDDRHKSFSYPIFSKISSKYIVSDKIDLTKEMKPLICFAGDIQRNFIELYKVIKVKKNIIECKHLDTGGIYSFYTDAVALIPINELSPKDRLKTFDSDQTK